MLVWDFSNSNSSNVIGLSSTLKFLIIPEQNAHDIISFTKVGHCVGVKDLSQTHQIKPNCCYIIYHFTVVVDQYDILFLRACHWTIELGWYKNSISCKCQNSAGSHFPTFQTLETYNSKSFRVRAMKLGQHMLNIPLLRIINLFCTRIRGFPRIYAKIAMLFMADIVYMAQCFDSCPGNQQVCLWWQKWARRLIG